MNLFVSISVLWFTNYYYCSDFHFEGVEQLNSNLTSALYQHGMNVRICSSANNFFLCFLSKEKPIETATVFSSIYTDIGPMAGTFRVHSISFLKSVKSEFTSTLHFIDFFLLLLRYRAAKLLQWNKRNAPDSKCAVLSKEYNHTKKKNCLKIFFFLAFR